MKKDAETHEYLLAPAEAILAGTLALMTGQAQASCHEARCLMTRRICANLAELGQQPALHPNFRAAVRHLNEHWCRMEAELSRVSSEPARRGAPWVAPCPTLQ